MASAGSLRRAIGLQFGLGTSVGGGGVLYLEVAGQVGARHDARHGREEHAEALHETGGGRRK